MRHCQHAASRPAGRAMRSTASAAVRGAGRGGPRTLCPLALPHLTSTRVDLSTRRSSNPIRAARRSRKQLRPGRPAQPHPGRRRRRRANSADVISARAQAPRGSSQAGVSRIRQVDAAQPRLQYQDTARPSPAWTVLFAGPGLGATRRGAGRQVQGQAGSAERADRSRDQPRLPATLWLYCVFMPATNERGPRSRCSGKGVATARRGG